MSQNIEIREEAPSVLTEYGSVPIAFSVRSRFRVEPVQQGLGGLLLREEPVEPPYIKDYDQYEGPERWLHRFDTRQWAVVSAFDGAVRVGGAVLAWNTGGVDMLEGRSDLCVLWDLRVAPDYRGQQVGRRLFEQAVNWARVRSCRQLKVETQDINVPACRFYARQGCVLGAIQRFAYPDLPDETQLFWYLDL